MQPIEKVKNVLVPICDNVGHYAELKSAFPRIVWEEDGAEGLRADNITQGQIFRGGIHLFSQNEFDPLFDRVQEALNLAQISFSLNSIQYEEENKVIHWEWIFSVV